MHMNSKSLMMIGAIVLGLIFVGIGVVYLTHQANALPAYFPGYAADVTKTHTKHGLAAFVLALASWTFAWFQGGPRKIQPTV
jgi:hypothetical protein